MLIDLLLTINTGQDIHELCKEYLWGDENVKGLSFPMTSLGDSRLRSLNICYNSYNKFFWADLTLKKTNKHWKRPKPKWVDINGATLEYNFIV